MLYMEELSAIRAELGVNSRLSDDTTSENEENYPQALKLKKRKPRVLMNLQSQIKDNCAYFNDDEDLRPVFSTLQRPEYSRSLLKREITDESYRAMLIEHKRRRTRSDVIIFSYILIC